MPTAAASSAMAAEMSCTSPGSHALPCVTSSGNTVPPATAECSASFETETGIASRDAAA